MKILKKKMKQPAVYLLSSHIILRELLYEFKQYLSQLFGPNFFKTTQIIGSYTDYIKTLNEKLNETDLSLKTPALLIQLNDISIYPNISNHPINPYRSTSNYGINYYPLLYNKTKDMLLISNVRYYSLMFTVNIIVNNQFTLVDAKKYLENFFPLNIPVQLEYYINSLIPIPKSLYENLKTNYNWDFDNDEMYYLYRQLDKLTGHETYFAPYLMQPIIIQQSIDKQDKQPFNADITGKLFLSFELRTYIPVTIFIQKEKKVIETINLTFEDLYDMPNYFQYLPTGIIRLDYIKQYNKEYRYLYSTYLTKENITETEKDNNGNITAVRIKCIIPKPILQNNNINNASNIVYILPIYETKRLSNVNKLSNIPDSVTIEVDKDTDNIVYININMKRIKEIDSNIYNELINFINGERRIDLYLYI